jgi:hypothetical protein
MLYVTPSVFILLESVVYAESFSFSAMFESTLESFDAHFVRGIFPFESVVFTLAGGMVYILPSKRMLVIPFWFKEKESTRGHDLRLGIGDEITSHHFEETSHKPEKKLDK